MRLRIGVFLTGDCGKQFEYFLVQAFSIRRIISSGLFYATSWHSPIAPEEMQAREAYYGHMIWIVDGTRGPLDASYFGTGMHREPIQNDPLAFQVDWRGKSRLLHNWGKATAKVYLDFGEQYLWRLVLFDEKKKWAAVGPIGREQLINDCLNGTKVSVLGRKG